MSKSIGDEKTRSTFRRLLLAKQLFLHGLDHSNKTGALNKMIAIHNFHNSIEIALRAIFLHYEIRPEKALNIEFEVMLNEIDNFTNFKNNDIRLPYRQEVRNLNQLRNWVQHHAVEPESSTMEDWRVFTQRFLRKACDSYFGLDFDTLSALDMIDDDLLKELLKKASLEVNSEDHNLSLILIRIAFEWSSKAIIEFLPQDEIKGKFAEGHFLEFDEINEAIYKATYYAALLATGVQLVDYKHFLSCTPYVAFMASGKPYVALGKKKINLEIVRWAYDFVVASIVHWQTLGLSPKVPDRFRTAAQNVVQHDDLLVDITR